MIAGIFHSGSGVGNQLHRYVATRVLALDKGYDFGMVAPDLCKAKDFMNLDMGMSNDFHTRLEMPAGKVSVQETHYRGKELSLWEEKTPYYNPEFNFIEDNTIIDGEFQDERYFGHRMAEISGWLDTSQICLEGVPRDLCTIGFRGGEFYTVPELGLPKSYYEKGINLMREINPDMKFEVHTDDEVLARQFFPDFRVVHDVGINWRTIRYSQYSIVANSSFYILPRLLQHWANNRAITIAPRYWDRYNIKKWERPYNYYKSFLYV